MLYSDDELGISFVIADALTVGKQLEYKSALLGFGDDRSKFYARLWRAAKTVITEWKCEYMPLDADLDSVTDGRIADVVAWAAIKVNAHMNDLNALPKN